MISAGEWLLFHGLFLPFVIDTFLSIPRLFAFFSLSVGASGMLKRLRMVEKGLPGNMGAALSSRLNTPLTVSKKIDL